MGVMRILIAAGIYWPETGGPAVYARNFARACIERGHTVTVVTYGDQRTLAGGDGYPVHVVSRVGGPIVRYVRYIFRVYRLARQADVVYLQGGVSEGLPGTLGAVCARVKTVMRVPGDYAWEMSMQQSGARGELLDEFIQRSHGGTIGWYERIERWTARRARMVIVPSRYLERIVQLWGVPTERIQVIQSTIEPLRVSRSREEVRRVFACGDQKVILTNVRAVPWKGVDFLIDVVARLPEAYVLVVIGEGPLLETWKQRAQDRGLASRVRFLGRVSREVVAEWNQAADVFVLPSGYEGYPHVVIEAVSMGLPCLVSDRGGNPETAQEFPEYVQVVPYQDHEAWVRALGIDRPRRAPAHIRSFTDAADAAMNILHHV